MTKTLRIEVTPAIQFAACEAWQNATGLSDEWMQAALTAAFQHPEFVRQIVPEWLPIESAPKDGTPVLLMFQNDAAKGFSSVQFVGRNTKDGAGWRFAAPVGYGGIGDGQLVGWQPLPEPSRASLGRLLGEES